MSHTATDLERRYAYLVATMPPQALAELHAGALTSMGHQERATILRAVQEGLGTGSRVTPDNTNALGRLVAHGNRTTPEQFTAACPADSRHALLESVVAHAGARLWSSYPAWVPPAPQPEDVPVGSAASRRAEVDPGAEARAFAAAHAMTVNPPGGY